jgi:hypothetical protein
MTRTDLEKWYKGVCGMHGRPATQAAVDLFCGRVLRLPDEEAVKKAMAHWVEADKAPSLGEFKAVYYGHAVTRRTEDVPVVEWTCRKRLTWYDPNAGEFWCGKTHPEAKDLVDRNNWTKHAYRSTLLEDEPVAPYWLVSVWTSPHVSGGNTYGFDVVARTAKPQTVGLSVPTVAYREMDEDEFPF